MALHFPPRKLRDHFPMIQEVLVICNDADVVALIRKAIGDEANLRTTTHPERALDQALDPLDLIFLDVALFSDQGSDSVEHLMRQFRSRLHLAQFVVLAPKSMVRRAVTAVKRGANDYLTYPIDRTEIELILETISENFKQDLELEYLRDKFWKSEWLDMIRTSNSRMRSIYQNIRNVAPTIATVLLLGETGTGKGLMARLMHLHSHRSDGPFVAVHCGAIPETLIESELFGHEKGAFTGADRKRIGKFQLAQDGTIFLDEIGTISTAVQIKLLQVLQDGTFSRIGSEEQLRSNARIIAATNADLQQMADAGTFRKDLLYRLNVFPIEMPPLRERLEDLPNFIDLFLANLNEKYGKTIKGLHPGIQDGLSAYSWPGNLRELENVLERAVILETGDTLMPSRFPAALAISAKMEEIVEDQRLMPLAEARQAAIDEFERLYLAKLLEQHKGKINISAEYAGITPRQLSRLISRHGLDKRKYR